MASRETSYTLTEAAEVTGRSRVTIRRYLDAGKFPNAWRDEASGETPAPWRVPLGDLVAAGMTVHPADRASLRIVKQADTRGVSDMTTNEAVAQLREELAVATALADERARTIEVLVTQVTELRTMLADALGTARAIAATQPTREET